MASKQIAAHRERAETYNGAAVCKQKVQQLLDQFHIPKGLMPLNNVVEFGYNATTGFLWLKQQKTFTYWFKTLGAASYGPEITAFIEDRRLRKLTGVKSKEMIIWVSLSDVSVDDSKITFATSMGLTQSYPVAEVEDDPQEMK
ncbi:hypothetical protein DITRI_Ditri02bG0055400 [Diplodiscus trichospermus]